MARGTWREDPEENARLQSLKGFLHTEESTTPWWGMPGVSDHWKTLTTPTEYHKPMKLEELSSSPAVAGELLSQYKSEGKGGTAQYTDPIHGAGKLYVNKQTGGEIRFIPEEKNQASYKQTEASLGTMDAVQQAVSMAGGLRMGVRKQTPQVRTTHKGDLRNKFSKWERSNLAAPVNQTPTSTKPTVKPNTTAGSLKHQSSRYDSGVDYVYKAAVIRGLNPKSKVKAMGDYGSGDISTGESAPTPTVRDHAWLVEQGKKVMRALNRKKPDYDTAYDWLSTWAPWGGHVYQTASAQEPGKKQHHKFPKYASAGFLLRMMELAHQGKADIKDILQLHNLAHYYSLAMGGGKWGIQNVYADPHDAGHMLARNMGWEHKGKPFQKVSQELLTLDTPEEVAYAMVDFIKTKGKPSLEAMLNLEKIYQEAFGTLNPEQMREFIFERAREKAEIMKKFLSEETN